MSFPSPYRILSIFTAIKNKTFNLQKHDQKTLINTLAGNHLSLDGC